MKKPTSHRVVKILKDPYKAKLLMRYFSEPDLRGKKIFIVEIDDDNLDIYEVDQNGDRIIMPELVDA